MKFESPPHAGESEPRSEESREPKVVGSLYRTLGVEDPYATSEDLKHARNKRMKEVHPDVGGSDQEMAEINEAYGVLSNELHRKLYDLYTGGHLANLLPEDATEEQLIVSMQKANRTPEGIQGMQKVVDIGTKNLEKAQVEQQMQEELQERARAVGAQRERAEQGRIAEEEVQRAAERQAKVDRMRQINEELKRKREARDLEEKRKEAEAIEKEEKKKREREAISLEIERQERRREEERKGAEFDKFLMQVLQKDAKKPNGGRRHGRGPNLGGGGRESGFLSTGRNTGGRRRR